MQINSIFLKLPAVSKLVKEQAERMNEALLKHCIATGTHPRDWEIDMSKISTVRESNGDMTITYTFKPYNPLDHMEATNDS